MRLLEHFLPLTAFVKLIYYIIYQSYILITKNYPEIIFKCLHFQMYKLKECIGDILYIC